MSEKRRPRILIVDEIEPIIRLIQLELDFQGFDVEGAPIGPGIYSYIEERRPDLIILEVFLPGIDGFQFLEDLKQRTDVPVVFLTTSKNEADRAMALEMGAIGYLNKPFEPDELGRSIAQFLGMLPAPPTVIRNGNLEVDLTRETVLKAGNPVSLTSNEWVVLLALARSPGLMQAEDLVRAAWGSSAIGGLKILRSIIERLRQVLEDDAARPKFVLGSIEEGLQLGLEE